MKNQKVSNVELLSVSSASYLTEQIPVDILRGVVKINEFIEGHLTVDNEDESIREIWEKIENTANSFKSLFVSKGIEITYK